MTREIYPTLQERFGDNPTIMDKIEYYGNMPISTLLFGNPKEAPEIQIYEPRIPLLDEILPEDETGKRE